MKYRKKPVVVETIKWTGGNLDEVKEFVGESLIYDFNDAAWEEGKGAPFIDLKIKTLEGEMSASYGDYIIKGVNGEFYPCKPDIFEKTYEIETGSMTFGQAFDMLRLDKCRGIRLPHWKEDVAIKIQWALPDGTSEMTEAYLYVQSRYGRVPWKETMIELFSNEWESVN